MHRLENFRNQNKKLHQHLKYIRLSSIMVHTKRNQVEHAQKLFTEGKFRKWRNSHSHIVESLCCI